MDRDPVIWITGYGMISALGKSVPDTLDSLQRRLRPLDQLTGFHSVYNQRLTVGQVPISNEALREAVNANPTNAFNRASLLALQACNETLAQVLNKNNYLQMALISGSTVGGVGVTFDHLEAINHGNFTANEAFINQMDCGSVGRSIALHFGIGGPLCTISTACSSSSNALLTGARMIRSGQVSMALCGGSDSLELFTINGFNSLKNVDADACRPFSADRNGLNLGEGAAYLLLESADHARARGSVPLATWSGGYNTVETFHMTGSSPKGEGAVMAMEGALKSAGLNAQDIDYIHAHGTGTIDNDLAEGVAIKQVFGSDAVFSSTKSMTGHTLAASGSIAAILTIIAMNNHIILPNENFHSTMPEHGLTPVTTLQSNKSTRHAMINSFGFGGSNTTIILSKAPEYDH